MIKNEIKRNYDTSESLNDYEGLFKIMSKIMKDNDSSFFLLHNNKENMKEIKKIARKYNFKMQRVIVKKVKKIKRKKIN